MKHLKEIENTQLIATSSIYNLFRIQHLACERASDGTYIFKATLYCDYCTLRVTWLEKSERKDLGYGVLVRAQWLTKRIFRQGTNIIQSLSSVGMLLEDETLDTTVISNWMEDSFAVDKILKTIASLPNDYKRLINQVLTNHYVFYHFLKIPGALNDEFEALGGNLERTLLQLDLLESDQVAERLMRPKKQLVAAVIMLGIGHYNQFTYDTGSHFYKRQSDKVKHNPKQVAIHLINEARRKLNMKDYLVFDRLIAVIMHLDF